MASKSAVCRFLQFLKGKIDPQRPLGERGELEARRYLQKQGFQIVETNVRIGRLGELDCIAKDRDTLVFVEVKTRESSRFGLPQEAITPKKAKRLLKLAEAYAARSAGGCKAMRIDVLALTYFEGEWQIEHFRNAVAYG